MELSQHNPSTERSLATISLLGPFAAVLLYDVLAFTAFPKWRGPGLWIPIVAAVVVGAAALWRALRCSRLQKALTIVVYVNVYLGLALWVSMSFACAAFDECR